MSQDLETTFEKLVKRKITDKERIQLYHVKDSLGLSDSSSIWQILIALDYHLHLYDEIPEKISKSSEEATQRAIAIINAQTRQSVAEADLTRARMAEELTVNAAVGIEDIFHKTVAQKVSLLQWSLILGGMGIMLIIQVLGVIAGFFMANKPGTLPWDGFIYTHGGGETLKHFSGMTDVILSAPIGFVIVPLLLFSLLIAIYKFISSMY